MNLNLIWCAFGWHSWYMYCCRSRTAERDTQRECCHCGLTQKRETQATAWGAA